jgi:hypothetical protein
MDNTVGSLTQLQKSIIIGSLLGDGYLRILPGRKDAFLEINHSIKAKEYVNWKFQMLRNICISGPKKRKGKGKRVAYRFFTRQHPELTELWRMFYRKGKKIIPSNLRLDPIILSVWFMDDGARCGNSNFYLNSQKFNKKDQKRLIEKLEILGLKARLNRDKRYLRIRFLSSSVSKLKEIIKRYLIPSMYYKVGL